MTPFPCRGYEYDRNPDTVVNQNGRTLIALLENMEGIIMVNGLKYGHRVFDGKLTYHRGKVPSRNDICLINNIQVLHNLKVSEKINLSDHCPMIIRLKINIDDLLPIVPECIDGLRNYDHYDKSKMIKYIVKLPDCDMLKVIDDWKEVGDEIIQKYTTPNTADTINSMCSELTEGIYKSLLRVFIRAY